MNRSGDWWEQAARDLRHAEHSLEDSDYEWAAFAAQQAAEKALKALILAQGGEPWGHSVTVLSEALPQSISAPDEVRQAANRLDKHYIPTRYPNGFAVGYPGKFYTRGEAEAAIGDARRVIDFCRRHLPE
jgi:HEPN domain-containing protein